MYKRSEERYAGGGMVKYVVYRSAQPSRGGRTRQRMRVKRLYFPADARDIELERPGTYEKRTGRRVHGVAVRYRYQLAGGPARRGNTPYRLPERWSERRQVVELPQGATDVRLTDEAPEGPRMAVA
jgi:hypothetical protein